MKRLAKLAVEQSIGATMSNPRKKHHVFASTENRLK